MNLCEQIYKYRCQKGMSQTELAEALEVSRQSVSKWETGTAVPELSKLMRMSELFEVSLDELVKGSEAQEREAGEATASENLRKPLENEYKRHFSPPFAPQFVWTRREGRITAAYFLLFFGGLTFLLFGILGGLAIGLITSMPLFLCALICFVCRHRAGLWCAWLIYWIVTFYLLALSGVSSHSFIMYAIFDRLKYGDMTIQFIISAVMFAAELAIIVATVYSFRKIRFKASRRSLLLLCGSTCGYIGFHVFKFFFYKWLSKMVEGNVSATVFSHYLVNMRFIQPLFSVITTTGFTVLAVCIFALCREWRANHLQRCCAEK